MQGAMLRQTNDVDARLLNEKFAADEKTFTFRYGGMEDYHSGLEGMIGNPDPRVAEAVEWEHTQSMESSKEFSCWWKGNTTAKTEYNYVVILAGGIDATICHREGCANNIYRIMKPEVKFARAINSARMRAGVTVWNNSAENIMGVRVEEVMGHNPCAGFLPADHHYATNAALDMVLRFREAAGFKFPVIKKTRAAAQYDIEASCGGEKITGVIDVGRVTARRQETAIQLNIPVQPINTADKVYALLRMMV